MTLRKELLSSQLTRKWVGLLSIVRHGLAKPGGLIPAGMYRYPTRFTATISVLNHSEPSGAGTNMGPRDMVKMGLDERSAREVASRLDNRLFLWLELENKMEKCALSSGA